MKRNTRNVLLIVFLIAIAGLLDLKYEGLAFQMLPKSVQSIITNIFT